MFLLLHLQNLDLGTTTKLLWDSFDDMSYTTSEQVLLKSDTEVYAL